MTSLKRYLLERYRDGYNEEEPFKMIQKGGSNKLPQLTAGQKKEIINDINSQPLSNDQITNLLPNAKIMRYSDLRKVNDLNDILTEPIDYVILLYETEPNLGHWITLLKYDQTYEYFDSYGNKINDPLKWNTKEKNIQLNQDENTLINLLNKSGYKVIYNKIKYQKDREDIQTCGRHALFRILNLILKNRTLDDYTKWMKFLKKGNNYSYDDIVSAFINPLSIDFVNNKPLTEIFEGSGKNKKKKGYQVTINNKKYIVLPSIRKHKKYDVYDDQENYIVSFGDNRYQHYKDVLGFWSQKNHLDKNRRHRYRIRHQKDNINDPNYAGFWSYYFLW